MNTYVDHEADFVGHLRWNAAFHISCLMVGGAIGFYFESVAKSLAMYLAG